MRVLVTGASGFMGRNLVTHLGRREATEVMPVAHAASPRELAEAAARADVVFHLAGVNRPVDTGEFESGNVEFTRALCTALRATGRPVPVVYTSSTQAALENPYGLSKRRAEHVLEEYRATTGADVLVFRLPNVFGKWCRPNYNSVVATFCHNLARDLPVQINDRSRMITLVYIDDVISAFLGALPGGDRAGLAPEVAPTYQITVGALAEHLQAFKESRRTLLSEKVGTGLIRALYATYVSYLPTSQFAYDVPRHSDPRGTFVEMLKTQESGQFSFFTARPGVTRGGHFHHTKVEKFLVLQGTARFRFHHVGTGERYELGTTAGKSQVVETVPGWAHDVTNTGGDELVVMLWANEVFDRARPDTFVHPV